MADMDEFLFSSHTAPFTPRSGANANNNSDFRSNDHCQNSEGAFDESLKLPKHFRESVRDTDTPRSKKMSPAKLKHGQSQASTTFPSPTSQSNATPTDVFCQTLGGWSSNRARKSPAVKNSLSGDRAREAFRQKQSDSSRLSQVFKLDANAFYDDGLESSEAESEAETFEEEHCDPRQSMQEKFATTHGVRQSRLLETDDEFSVAPSESEAGAESECESERDDVLRPPPRKSLQLNEPEPRKSIFLEIHSESPTSEAKQYDNFDENNEDDLLILADAENELKTRLDRFYTGGCSHYESDHEVRLFGLRENTTHYVRVAKTTYNSHLTLLVFDSASNEPEHYFSIGLVPKDLRANTFGLLARPAIIGSNSVDVTVQSIMMTSERLLSKGKKGHAIPKKATSHAGLSTGNEARNLNVGKKVNFPGQKFPFHEGFIKKVHASSEIDYDLHQPRSVIIEVAFAETKRNSLDEALNAIHKKKKFFKWHQVDNRTGKHQEHDHDSTPCSGFWREVSDPENDAPRSDKQPIEDDINASIAFTEADATKHGTTIQYDRDDVEWLEFVAETPFHFCDHSVGRAEEFDFATPVHPISCEERQALIKTVLKMKNQVKWHKGIFKSGLSFHSGTFIQHLLKQCVPSLELKFEKVNGEFTPLRLSDHLDRHLLATDASVEPFEQADVP